VLQKLGVNGEFESPGGWNAAIVGSPDFSWIVSPEWHPHPKLIVRTPVAACLLVVKLRCVG
jgi:hypothetical protein